MFIDNVLVDDLVHTHDGFYESELLGEQGKLYALEVTIPNFSTVRSQTFLPHSEFIRSIRHINDAGRDDDGLSCPALRITFTNNPNELQYFELSVRKYHEGWTWREDTIPASTSPVHILNTTDPVLLGEGLPLLVFSNRMIKDTIYTMYLEYTTGRASSSGGNGWQTTLYPLVIELRSISASYYHYLRSVYLYERNIFESTIGEVYPPHQLHSNVEGGFGMVGAFSRYVYDTIFPTR